jgi:hypothetical protein
VTYEQMFIYYPIPAAAGRVASELRRVAPSG